MSQNHLNLCSSVLSGLGLLNQPEKIDLETLTNSLNLVSESLISGHSNQLNSDSSAHVKLLSVSLACLFIETCRADSSKSSQLMTIRHLLESKSVCANYLNQILETFSNDELHSALTKRLQSCDLPPLDTYSSSHIYRLSGSADIRQDYVIKSRKSSWEQITQTEYVVQLPTAENRDVLFSCSLQNIEDMTIKLRECLNKIQQTFHTAQ